MTITIATTMTWKVIPDFPEYEVSEHGHVRHGTKHLKPEIVKGSGRKRFSLSKNGRLYRIAAHRLVAFAFIGPPPFEGAEVCHKDGFKHNNHHSNLRWGTSGANGMDVVRHGIERQEKFGRTSKLAVAYSKFVARHARRI